MDSNEVDSLGSSKDFHEYPCLACGSFVSFDINSQSLKCSYCGYQRDIESLSEAGAERSYEEYLKKPKKNNPGAIPLPTSKTFSCQQCKAEIALKANVVGLDCPFCSSPLHEVLNNSSSERLPVDGILSFRVDIELAQSNLKKWAQRLWFAPSEFNKTWVKGKFTGIYSPYFSFDSRTVSSYRGRRGITYIVTVGSGKNRRTETRVSWTPVAGQIRHFFDDVLTSASQDINRSLIRKLEPWPLEELKDFNPDYLPGFCVRTYDIELSEGFTLAKERIDQAIYRLVLRDIGGDRQEVHQINTIHQGVSYRYILLPLWILSYRYNNKVFQVLVNGSTGKVSGERPWSWFKILLVTLSVILVLALLILYLNDPLVFKTLLSEWIKKFF